MTIRELFISLGFEVDAQSEKKAEAAIQGLKNTAAAALNAVNTEPLREGMERLPRLMNPSRKPFRKP